MAKKLDRRYRQDGLREAARQGLAAGLRQHLPTFVGVVVAGPPIAGLAAFIHLVVGLSGRETLAAVVATGAAGAVARLRR
jgi:hypothetical protein